MKKFLSIILVSSSSLIFGVDIKILQYSAKMALQNESKQLMPLRVQNLEYQIAQLQQQIDNLKKHGPVVSFARFTVDNDQYEVKCIGLGSIGPSAGKKFTTGSVSDSSFTNPTTEHLPTGYVGAPTACYIWQVGKTLGKPRSHTI